MLLPHGYEGQGPEHSSARLERYLQLCAEDNMQVANLHDAGQLFPRAAPPAEARLPQAAGRDDAEVAAAPQAGGVARSTRWARARPSTGCCGTTPSILKGEKIKLVPDEKMRRVVLCSGKVYYDLYEEREKRGIDDVYLLRVEQLYPFPAKALITELSRFRQAEMVWCQEEPKNMGAWSFVEPYLRMGAGQHRCGAARDRAMSAGPPRRRRRPDSWRKHLAQLAAFLDEAFAE